MLFQNLKIQYCVTSKHTEFKILCLVNKTRVLLLFTFVLYWYNFKSDVASSVDDVIYGPIESVYKVFPQDNWSKKGNSLLYFICKQMKKISCVYITMNSYHGYLYISYNLTSKIQILINHTK